MMKKFFLIAVLCPLGLAACSDGGPQFDGPKADMTANYPGASLALGKVSHKKPVDKVPFLSMPANAPEAEDVNVMGMTKKDEATPHPVKTDTQVSYGADR